MYSVNFLRKNSLQIVPQGMPCEDLIFNLSAWLVVSCVVLVNTVGYHYIRRETGSLLSRYKCHFEFAMKYQYQMWEKFLNQFHVSELERTAILNEVEMEFYSGGIVNLVRPDSRRPFKQRTEWLKTNVFENMDNINKLIVLKSTEMTSIMFWLCYRYTSPVVMNIIYTLIFYIRHRFQNAYSYIRK
jgi:hypothetical protein